VRSTRLSASCSPMPRSNRMPPLAQSIGSLRSASNWPSVVARRAPSRPAPPSAPPPRQKRSTIRTEGSPRVRVTSAKRLWAQVDTTDVLQKHLRLSWSLLGGLGKGSSARTGRCSTADALPVARRCAQSASLQSCHVLPRPAWRERATERGDRVDQACPAATRTRFVSRTLPSSEA
jgi:hypothetical protein